jgi:hypothetical protein
MPDTMAKSLARSRRGTELRINRDTPATASRSAHMLKATQNRKAIRHGLSLLERWGSPCSFDVSGTLSIPLPELPIAVVVLLAFLGKCELHSRPGRVNADRLALHKTVAVPDFNDLFQRQVSPD